MDGLLKPDSGKVCIESEDIAQAGEKDHVYWKNINLTGHTVRVSHKPDRNWTPKAYKEREIPIPAKLVEGLRQWKAKSNKACDLVFPTSGCSSKRNFLIA